MRFPFEHLFCFLVPNIRFAAREFIPEETY